MAHPIERSKNSLHGNHAHRRHTDESAFYSIEAFARLAMTYWGLILFLVTTFVGSAIFYHKTFPSYIAKASLALQGSENSPLQAILSSVAGIGIGPRTANRGPTEHYVHFLQSPDFCDALRDHLEAKGLMSQLHRGVPKLAKARNKEAVSEVLRGVIQFRQLPDDIILLIVETADKDTAVRMANLVINFAVESMQERDSAQIVEAIKYIEDQLVQIERRLRIAEHEKLTLKISGDAEEFLAGDSSFRADVFSFKRKLQDLKIRLELNQNLIRSLEKENTNSDTKNILKSELARQFEGLKRRKVDLELQGVDDDANEYRSVTAELQELSIRLRQAAEAEFQENVGTAGINSAQILADSVAKLRVENQALQLEIRAIEKSIAQSIKSKKEVLPDDQRLLELSREAILGGSLLMELKQKLTDVQIQKILLNNRFRILEHPSKGRTVQKNPIFVKVLGMALLALLVSFIIVTFREASRVTMKSSSDLNRLGLISLGDFPRIPDFREAKWPWQSKRDYTLPTIRAFSMSDSPQGVALKQIRTLLLNHSRNAGKETIIISVVSAFSGEGKTLLSNSIAHCLGQLGKPLLLIDCDVRKASTTKLYGYSDRPGLAEISAHKISTKAAIIPSSIPHVDILPAGKMNDQITEYFESTGFKDLIENLKKQYAFIVLDSPPVLVVPEATLIALTADLPIFAVRSRVTAMRDLEEAMARISSVTDKPLHAVLCDGPARITPYAYYYQRLAKAG